MFIGHFGLSLAAKKLKNTVQSGTAILAAQFLDLLWPIFVLLGLENFSIEPGNTKLTPLNFEHYPYTHSLTGSLILAFLFALVYYVIKKDFKTSFIYGLLVFSHWVLDFLTHRADLPISFSADLKVGLGLWNYPALSIVAESIIYITGVYFYLKSTEPLNKKGSIFLWIIIILLPVFYILNIIGPPPPDVITVTYSALLLWLFVWLGYLTDKNRRNIS